MLHRAKRYVSVIAVTGTDGTMSPIDIGLDGRRYVVDEVLDARRARSMKCGGRGMRYTVRIGNAVTYLFFEDPRWFVEAKVYGELAGR